MADIVAGLFGGGKSAAASASSDAAGGFADFAASLKPSASAASASASKVFNNFLSSATGSAQPVPYTKWYRVWERTQLSDFYNELFVIPFIAVFVAIHLWGTSANRSKAKAWIKKAGPLLSSEYAIVGFGGVKGPSAESVEQEGLLHAENTVTPEDMLRENAANEFVTYATGRQNVAFLDVKLTLIKRFNPFLVIAENLVGFFFESLPATQETVEAICYTFDGKEKDLVKGGADVKVGGNSTYDGFVWGIVNKTSMTLLREDRYDLSLTSTKEHPKLPAWTTVMSESAEVTDTLLTPELVKAIEEAGDDLIALIVTDQPADKPKTINDTTPRKRLTLQLKLTSGTNTDKLFAYFLRLPDILVAQARFRPEVMKRIKQTREDEIKKIKKVAEEADAETRKEKTDREKKEKRDAMLKGLSSEEQRKFLDKEREKGLKKAQKRRTMRG